MIEGTTKQASAVQERVSTFVYGPGGSGKTRFCATFPKPYFIVTERIPRGLEVAARDIPYVKVETFEDLLLVFNQIEAGKRAVGCESICLDSLSDITPLVCDYVLRKAGKPRMALQEWGFAVDHLRSLIRTFTATLSDRFYVCLTALATVQKDDLTGEILGLPETIGRFAQVVPAMFDLALYSEQTVVFDPVSKQSKPTWLLHSVSHGRFKAKDGIGFMDVTEPNDMGALIAKYKAVREHRK